jgi:Uma2 family endonuclease
MKLSAELERFFRNSSCRPFAAPFDVKLSKEDIVQPDLMVVCDPEQIKETHIEGAPKLVIEIVSPASESFDRLAKMKLYER